MNGLTAKKYCRAIFRKLLLESEKQTVTAERLTVWDVNFISEACRLNSHLLFHALNFVRLYAETFCRCDSCAVNTWVCGFLYSVLHCWPPSGYDSARWGQRWWPHQWWLVWAVRVSVEEDVVFHQHGHGSQNEGEEEVEVDVVSGAVELPAHILVMKEM